MNWFGVRSLRCISIGCSAICLQACMADFVAPLSVVSRRYPSVGQLSATERSVPKRQIVESSTSTQSDRVPTPREIFDFHPKGLAADQARQPFLVNPNEGPLKIPKFAAADAANAPSTSRVLLPGGPAGEPTPQHAAVGPDPSTGHE